MHALLLSHKQSCNGDHVASICSARQQQQPSSARAAAGKGRIIEFSIQEAYVTAIRRARNFLYLESQYFIGSAHAWPEYINGGGAINLIPLEIALKIACKIRARQRFAAYILLPMWPEGILTAIAIRSCTRGRLMAHHSVSSSRPMCCIAVPDASPCALCAACY